MIKHTELTPTAWYKKRKTDKLGTTKIKTLWHSYEDKREATHWEKICKTRTSNYNVLGTLKTK